MAATPRRRKRAEPIASNAVDIAFEAVANDATLDSPARGLLIDQRRLINAQLLGERLSNGLKIATGAAGLAVAVAAGVMVWQASRADGLVIKAFATPPSLVARGVTGEAVAAQLLDRLNAMVTTANSAEPQRRVAGDPSRTISIQIPQTGLSISQVDQWLREVLGQERQVSGELMIGDGGAWVLSARNGATPLPSLTGAPAELPVLLQQTAETILAREQPDTYASFLINVRRLDDAITYLQTRIASDSVDEQARAHDMIGTALAQKGEQTGAFDAFRRSVDLNARPSWRAMGSIAPREADRGHPEAAARYLERYLEEIRKNDPRDRLTAQARRLRVLRRGSMLATLRGDHGFALDAAAELNRLGSDGAGAMGVLGQRADQEALAYAALHDVERAAALIAKNGPPTVRQVSGSAYQVAAAAGDWPRALAAIEEHITGYGPAESSLENNPVAYAMKARALRFLGRLEDAAAALEATPLDCQDCVMERGLIAAARGDKGLADHWLGQAVRMAPTIPFANYEWGQVLLARGDLEGAALRFEAASQQGPRFADPLSAAGEVLLLKGDPKAAAAKFSEANKLAPRWGRNHLLWGEALAKLGKTGEAKAQWKIAAALDLSGADRARLAANLGKKL